MEIRALGAGELIIEVISVGTELLIGQIVNSNTAVIAQRLAEEGFDSHYQVVVGDNLERVVGALEQALGRADAVVVTGGIGPTQDDLTREAICKVAARTMTRDEDHAAWIDKRIRAQRGSVPENVLRMAGLPEGAEGIPNPSGVALGVALQHQGSWIFAMPGVPAEMTAMLDAEVMPRLRALDRQPAVLRSRVIHTWGLGESQVAELLGDLFDSKNPSIAFLIREMEVRVRISAKAADDDAAMGLIEPLEKEVRSRLGEAVFATDAETVEAIIIGDLESRGWTLGTIERATLGEVGARVAATDGSTGVFAGSVIPAEGGLGTAILAADVVLRVGEIGSGAPGGERTTRSVEMSVETPEQVLDRTYQFGGTDERVRSFATVAGLHMIRLGIQVPPGRE